MAQAARVDVLRRVTAAFWVFNAALGTLLVLFGLGISDPVEPEDKLLLAVFLVLFVIGPIALAFASHKRQSLAVLGPMFAGALLVPGLLYWIVVYG